MQPEKEKKKEADYSLPKVLITIFTALMRLALTYGLICSFLCNLILPSVFSGSAVERNTAEAFYQSIGAALLDEITEELMNNARSSEGEESKVPDTKDTDTLEEFHLPEKMTVVKVPGNMLARVSKKFNLHFTHAEIVSPPPDDIAFLSE